MAHGLIWQSKFMILTETDNN